MTSRLQILNEDKEILEKKNILLFKQLGASLRWNTLKEPVEWGMYFEQVAHVH